MLKTSRVFFFAVTVMSFMFGSGVFFSLFIHEITLERTIKNQGNLIEDIQAKVKEPILKEHHKHVASNLQSYIVAMLIISAISGSLGVLLALTEATLPCKKITK